MVTDPIQDVLQRYWRWIYVTCLGAPTCWVLAAAANQVAANDWAGLLLERTSTLSLCGPIGAAFVLYFSDMPSSQKLGLGILTPVVGVLFSLFAFFFVLPLLMEGP